MPQKYVECLERNDAVLVHCSSQTVLVGNQQTYSLDPLERIKEAIRENHVLSCSTITKGDTVVNNYSGCIGIIISPKTPESITFASPSDYGSNPDIREKSRQLGCICNIPDFEKAICERQGYNEIFAHTLKVHGIFISRPVQFIIKEDYIQFSDEKIYSEFPEVTFYECFNGDFYEIVFDVASRHFFRTKLCSFKEIYT